MAENDTEAQPSPTEPATCAKPTVTGFVNDSATKALGVVLKYGERNIDKVVEEMSAKASESAITVNDTVLREPEKFSRYQDLGLGRGVDGTERTPWLHKSSFQVREVLKDNLIGTEEGGSLHSYVDEVTSVKTQQAKLDISITVPNEPVRLGVDSELTRNVTITQKAIGRRVINRTVSFVSQFDDLAPATRNPSGDQTFQERLAKYILKCAGTEELDSLEESELLTKITAHLDDANEEDVVKCCKEFVERFRVTHYVSSISLGASEYFVESESDYYSKSSSKGNVGYESIAKAEASLTFTKKLKKKSNDLQHIGKIDENGEVERGSKNEAVIGVKVEPIYFLIQVEKLRELLKKALNKYIDSRHRKNGPYVISCDDSEIFWMVKKGGDDRAEVYGTRNILAASLFYVFPTGDGKHPYEFCIGGQGGVFHPDMEEPDPSLEKHTIRYLNAPIGISGRHHGPLHLESLAKKHLSRFSLHTRLTKRFDDNVDPEEWFFGKESFLIECTRRITWDGYIGVQQRGVQEMRDSYPNIRYKTTCIPSTKSHNYSNIWMVFRLHSHEQCKELAQSGTNEASGSKGIREPADTERGGQTREQATAGIEMIETKT